MVLVLSLARQQRKVILWTHGQPGSTPSLAGGDQQPDRTHWPVCRRGTNHRTGFALDHGSLWQPAIHISAGNLLLADGSVSQVSNRILTNFNRARCGRRTWEGAVHLFMP